MSGADHPSEFVAQFKSLGGERVGFSIQRDGRYYITRSIAGKCYRHPSYDFASTAEAAEAHDLMILNQTGLSPGEVRQLGLCYDLGLHNSKEVERRLEGTDAAQAFASYPMHYLKQAITKKQLRAERAAKDGDETSIDVDDDEEGNEEEWGTEAKRSSKTEHRSIR